ncbi:MAG: thioredoxin fold domain-containing protein [Xanthomonadales bacterium]|nr:thioredoxin fold domain-containing protein [Gammaproteobacteria bacterium]MBT8074572.1 thioredoxin fold domain-containing protein [Gammaproteobacteria bacterium]NNK05425.1 thioredoxin fold domain-containing protein [Xanthomonadales bacterium]
MIRIPLIFAALTANLLMTAAYAETTDPQDFDAVEAKLRGLVPNAKTIAVSETPIAGVLQVQINSDIVYVTSDGKYLLQGQIMDIDSRSNLTDQAKSGIRLDLLTGLNEDEQITFAPVEPEHSVLVFTDIDCGYCRKLHNEMAEYNEQGIAIHYLAFPRAGIGSASFDKFVSVWCADDQKSALTLAKNGSDPEPQKCPNPIAEQYDLGREVGVTGTPALVTTDGTLIPGYMPPAQLRARLDSLKEPAE